MHTAHCLSCCTVCTVVLTACTSPSARTADTASATEGRAMTAAAKSPLAPADVAGRWKVRAMNYRGDSLTGFEIVATKDTSGWTLTFPNRPALPLQIITVAGDSIVTETGPYPSVLRRTVGVRSLRSVHRLEGNELVGSFTARYETTGPDSVLHGTHVGTRIQ